MNEQKIESIKEAFDTACISCGASHKEALLAIASILQAELEEEEDSIPVVPEEKPNLLECLNKEVFSRFHV